MAVPIPLVFAKVNAHLEERRQGKLHYCSACGAASRAERYCDQCGALIVLVDAIADLDAEIIQITKPNRIEDHIANEPTKKTGNEERAGAELELNTF